MGYSSWGHKDSDTTQQLHHHLYIFAEVESCIHRLTRHRTLAMYSFTSAILSFWA